jgi:hypothetical protein
LSIGICEAPDWRMRVMLSFIERTGLAEYTCVTFVPGLDHGSGSFSNED